MRPIASCACGARCGAGGASGGRASGLRPRASGRGSRTSRTSPVSGSYSLAGCGGLATGLRPTGVALTALVLAAAGVYAVTSFFVTQRTRELGLRVALGAEPARVAGLVLRQGAVTAAIGIVVGLGCSVAGAMWLEASLYGVRAAEPLAYIGAAAIIGLTAIAATYSPARRASHVDPMVALRMD